MSDEKAKLDAAVMSMLKEAASHVTLDEATIKELFVVYHMFILDEMYRHFTMLNLCLYKDAIANGRIKEFMLNFVNNSSKL